MLKYSQSYLRLKMAQLKFVGRISSQGENLIIWIPKEYHRHAKSLKGRQVKIVIDDIF
jgi:hypothetical protein